MSSINFDNPYLLFLAIPLVALFVVPYALAVRKDNINGHNIASGIIHIIMAVLIAFVAAGTSIVTTVTETNVYVVADVSFSANRNLDTVDRCISDLGGSLPRNSKLGVITFGKTYELLTPLGAKTQSVKNSRVDDSATDIISALRYTGELFREDVVKRIVLITDGRQTGETDSNALKRQVDALAERNIHVDAIYLDDNLRDGAREVQLSAVQVTPTTFLNGETTARLTVNCCCPATSTDVNGETVPYEVNTKITVTRQRTDEESEPEEYISQMAGFTNGGNYYDLPLYTAEAGVYDYVVSIAADDKSEDENDRNNVISFTQEVAGKQSVLVIYDDIADDMAIRGAYGESADITSYYYGSNDILLTFDWVNKFDEIVLATANVKQIGSRGTADSTNYKLFLNNIDRAVSKFGKSLVTFGDTNIQNNADDLKQLSDMLPVVYSRGEGESTLYTLLIDTSRSMEQGGRLNRAKNAAIEYLKMLDDNDTAYVVQFNGTTADIPPTMEKLSVSRERLIEQIENLTVHQSTNIPAALQYVVPAATGGDYANRRLLFFSDGMNFTTDTATQDVQASIMALLRGGVVTTALDVGRTGVSDDANAKAVNLLQNTIAGIGGGEYIDIRTDDNLKKALDTQMPADINNSVGENSTIKVKRRADEVLEGIDAGELQSDRTALVNKFIYSKAKSAATTVLTVDYETRRTVKDEHGNPYTVTATSEVPLYSYWEYGSGRVASLTTGLSIGENENFWIDMSEELRSRIISNVLRTGVPAQKISEPFMLDIETADGYAAVSLTPETMSLDAVTSIEITSPNGKTSKPVPLADAASKYTYTFGTGDAGKYTVKITYRERATAEQYTVERAVHVSYPAEYDSFALYDAGTLHKMIGAQGTVSENGKLTIVNDASEIGLYNVSLNMPLLIACVVLFAVDIAVRKLKWEDIRSLFKRRKKG